MTETYKEICLSEIEGQITTYPTQPIIFAGAGLSKRWFGAPSWPELLEQCVNDCPEISKSLAYFSQSCKEYPEIATAISDYYREWAWNSGSNSFPDALFEAGVDREEYLKYWVAKKFLDLGLDTAHLSEDFLPESAAFQSIRPHAIITTNYDRALEGIFPDYEPISRDELIPRAYSSVGEIVKIHGCATDHRSLVLTRRDYDDFLARRKYLSAKLLTYFNEHPILIVGYSASDPNIAGILSDIDEALAMPGELIQNIFLLERAPSSGLPQTERLIQVSDNRSVRVRTIQSNDWEWVFKAFSHRAPLENVNPRILRSILARSFNLVRSDIPKQTLEVDFDFIEGSIESDEALPSFLGSPHCLRVRSYLRATNIL